MSIQGIFRAPKLNPSKFESFDFPELRRSGEAERFFATEKMGAFLQMTGDWWGQGRFIGEPFEGHNFLVILFR